MWEGQLGTGASRKAMPMVAVAGCYCEPTLWEASRGPTTAPVRAVLLNGLCSSFRRSVFCAARMWFHYHASGRAPIPLLQDDYSDKLDMMACCRGDFSAMSRWVGRGWCEQQRHGPPIRIWNWNCFSELQPSRACIRQHPSACRLEHGLLGLAAFPTRHDDLE